MIRDIKYEGLKSASTSDVLDRFKERKVGLVVESQYDPNVINHAAVVLKELIAERGHQFATVTPELRRIPPASLEVIFAVNEGPKVKVGKITITGNEAFSQRDVIRAMKNLHPIGIPYSIFLEDLFAKTYDASKLEEDKERIRDAYQKEGYFTAKALEQTLKLHSTGGATGGFHIPILKENHLGEAQDITLPVEEGQRFYLAKLDFTGVKLFRSTDFLGNLFQMKKGDVFSTEKLRNGIKNLTKVYSQFGYIDYVGEPQIDIEPNSNKIDLSVNVDEGKQFFVRRIEFTGNTTTRDKVIRRELLIDEGDVYNSSLWDASILRLNQLGYFEALKENEAYTLNRNPGSSTVDINLKVKERGKNSISLNGGVSGIAGTFVGLNYSTNNFLGLGDTLSIGGQVGTLTDNVSIGFTHPYIFDKPLTAGISVYLRRFDYNQGRQISLLEGVNVTGLYNALGSANVLNYIQDSKGVSASASYPIKRSFARLGLALGYDISSIKTESTGAATYFNYLSFERVNGPNALNGIRTLSVTPSYSYNSKNNFLNPSAGKSIFFSIQAAGSVLGANVNSIHPTFDGQYYHPSPKWRKNVLAFHLTLSTIFGYGGKSAPPQARIFMGGENDVRGFQFYSISPVAYLPSQATVSVLHADGSTVMQKVLVDGILTSEPVSQSVPIYQIITPGGDTQGIFNFEYRIPIFGPVTMAPFFDAGVNKVAVEESAESQSGRNHESQQSRSRRPLSLPTWCSSPERRSRAYRPVLSFRWFCPSCRPRSAYTTLITRWLCASTCRRRSWPTARCSRTRPRSLTRLIRIPRRTRISSSTVSSGLQLAEHSDVRQDRRFCAGPRFLRSNERLSMKSILLPALALAALSAQAQNLAVIDMQGAILQTTDGQKAAQELKAKYDPDAAGNCETQPGADRQTGRISQDRR